MRSSKRLGVRLGAISAVACTVGLFLPAGIQAASAAAAVVASPSQGAYVPLATPMRIADTRLGFGEPYAGDTLAPSGTLTLTMPAAVPSTATAVALSLTEVDATADGYLSVYPTGDVPLTPTAVVNFVAGPANCSTPDCVVPNLVVSKLTTSPAGGQVTIFNGSSGTVDVVADLAGYFDPTVAATGTAGQYYTAPGGPYRVADTRCAAATQPSYCANEDLPGPQSPTLGTGQTLDVPVLGTLQPGLGISAVVVQIAATNTTSKGYLTAYAGGPTIGTTPPPPLAANVNFVAGQTASTRAIVPVGPNGDIEIYNYLGNTDVVVDVDGFFSDGTDALGAETGGSGLLYTPVEPGRLADTRSDDSMLGAFTTGESASLVVAGNPTGNIPATVNGAPPVAAFLNVAEASATSDGYLTLTPGATSPPGVTADVNFNAGQTRSNADLAELDQNGNVTIFNYAGTTQLAIDAFGYFAPPAPQEDAG